jgi:hypothetical protein
MFNLTEDDIKELPEATAFFAEPIEEGAYLNPVASTEEEEPADLPDALDDEEDLSDLKVTEYNERLAKKKKQKPADNDQTRYQYWQSQATKAQNALKEKEEALKELEAIKDYKDVAKYLAENPTLVDELGEYIQTKGKPKETTPAEAPVELARPEMPVKPSGFNVSDLLDPTSESYAYEQAYRDYQLATMEWHTKALEIKEKEHAKALQIEKQIAMQKRKEQEFASSLVQNGLRHEEILDFFDIMNKPAASDPKALIKYYKLLKGQASVVDSKQEAFEKQKQRSTIPMPLGEGGDKKTIKDESELFNDALFAACK